MPTDAGFLFGLPTSVTVVVFSWLDFAYQVLSTVEAVSYGSDPIVIGLIVGPAGTGYFLVLGREFEASR